MSQVENLAQALQQIGLREKEALVYLALLPLGSATAYRIAETCAVKKPTVYVILEELRKKGLILKIPHAKKALFSAVNIGEYLRGQESKIRAVHQLMPKFDTLSETKGSSVYFFTGIQGIAQAIDYKLETMRGKTFHCFYGSLIGCENTLELMHVYEKWDRKAIGSGISFRIVTPKKGSEQNYKNLFEIAKKDAGVQIRLLDQYDYPPNASIGVGADFLWILDEKNLQATVIDNTSTADAMRQIFNIVWEKGV